MAPNLKNAKIAVDVNAGSIAVLPGESVTVYLRCGRETIPVELHVTEEGEMRVLLKPEHMNIVAEFDSVYGTVR